MLIGAKGSGKSYIGSLFQKHFNIPFVRVEDWAKQVKGKRSVTDESYISEVFAAIQQGITQEMQKHNAIVFESTGTVPQFVAMVNHLKQQFNVVQIFIEADLELCLQRVKTRDQSIHINVSDEQVMAINQAVNKNHHAIAHTIQNNNKTEEQLVAEIGGVILQKTYN